MFGHYEDADLCLKSLHAGAPAWLHDQRMWHLEGKGAQPAGAGRRCAAEPLALRAHVEWTIVPHLLGRTPRHHLLQARSAEAAASAGTTGPAKPAPSPAHAEPRKAPPFICKSRPSRRSPHASLAYPARARGAERRSPACRTRRSPRPRHQPPHRGVQRAGDGTDGRAQPGRTGAHGAAMKRASRETRHALT